MCACQQFKHGEGAFFIILCKLLGPGLLLRVSFFSAESLLKAHSGEVFVDSDCFFCRGLYEHPGLFFDGRLGCFLLGREHAELAFEQGSVLGLERAGGEVALHAAVGPAGDGSGILLLCVKVNP